MANSGPSDRPWLGLPASLSNRPSQSDISRAHSSRTSHETSGSQDRLLQPSLHENNQTPGSTVPDAPRRTQLVAHENPVEAIDRPLSNAAEIRNNHREYDDLNFWPTILKAKTVAFLVSLYLALAVVIGMLVWGAFKDPDHTYELSSENVRVVSRYFPSIIGTITVVLFRQTIRETLRMEPFINMADQTGRQNPGVSPADGVGGAWFPWQNITTVPPGLLSFSSIIAQVIVSFVVSFKVALLASAETEEQGKHAWILTVRIWPALFLILIYILVALYTICLCLHSKGKSTGLRWDPASIADYASLFAYCNALDYFAPLELRHDLRPKDVMPADRLFRLGYWTRVRSGRDGTSEEDTVYGIGVSYERDNDPGQPRQLIRAPLGRPWYHVFRRRNMPDPQSECKFPQRCANGILPQCEHYPYNENPGCPRWIIAFASFWPIAVFALSIYALVIRLPFTGFDVNNNVRMPLSISWSVGHKNHTIFAIDPIDPYSRVLFWALVLRSAPTYVAGIFTSTIIVWLDLNMRFMQPFSNMMGKERPVGESTTNAPKNGVRWKFWTRPTVVRQPPSPHTDRKAAKAEESILLAYITQSAMQVPLTAWKKSHMRVFVYSVLNTISPLFPILVGGLITLTPSKDNTQVHCEFSLSAWIGVMIFLVAYSILIPSALPKAYQLLPRQLYSLADLMILCYEAKFLQSPYLNIADRTRTPTQEHMKARLLLADDRFLFGRYTGRDGKQHIGFDVAEQRDPDFGELRILPNSVEHIPHEPFINSLKRATTTTVEWGLARARTMTGLGGSKKKKDDTEQELQSLNPQDADTVRGIGEASGSQRPSINRESRARVVASSSSAGAIQHSPATDLRHNAT